ncbi:MAG: type II 3-dehydroquinate dehydratase [Oscillospiraceae bacterium]|jgi:3-dehydroquinate dehydratase-2|nr:type II 3-dehydroquinate dehydratase [Oscillospiraceae bacterium]
MKILIVNGCNLNLLGTREPEIYGSKTLSDIEAEIMQKCEALGCECGFFQSNCEGAITGKLHEARLSADGVILNAGAFTHYSYAIRDAIAAISIPVIEVHMSNIYAREEFRHKSVLSEVCKGVICGFGSEGYLMAAEYLINNSKGAGNERN